MSTFETERVVESGDAEATVAFGRRLGRAIERPPLVIALVGPLGAGKTLLVRGLALGLDVADPRAVSSPTFVLLQEYWGRLPLYHFDAYRLSGPDQFAALGPEEYFESDGVCVIEWADRVAELLPADRLQVELAITGRNSRRITVRAAGHPAQLVLGRLC